MQLTQVTQETISFCMFTATIFTGQPGTQSFEGRLLPVCWTWSSSSFFFFHLPWALSISCVICLIYIAYYTIPGWHNCQIYVDFYGFLCSQRMRHRIILRQSPERYKMYKHHHQCHSQGWHRSQPLPPFNSIFVIIIIFICSLDSVHYCCHCVLKHQQQISQPQRRGDPIGKIVR